MNKILIIGQALPAVKQQVPYDTTMLYDWLIECGITKEKAQEMFVFDAVFGAFTGFDKNGGHLKPTKDQIQGHWINVLSEKFMKADKVWLVGNVAKEMLAEVVRLYPDKKYHYSLHPSKRNLHKFRQQKEEFLINLKSFIWE